MKIYGHVKVLKKENKKLNEKDAVIGTMAWQEPKGKDDPLKFGEIPFLFYGKRGEAFAKYSEGKDGNVRYLMVDGVLRVGQKGLYVQLEDWSFPPYEPKKDSGDNNPPSGGDDGYF